MDWAPSGANGYPVIAPGSFASVYGDDWGIPSPQIFTPPCHTTQGGVSLILAHSEERAFSAPLVYVSKSQINFIVPGCVAPGTATPTLQALSGTIYWGTPKIRPVAPALFACSPYTCAEAPVSLANRPVYTSFYGTGILARGRARCN